MTASAAAERPLSIVILGLSITSSWGNGHAVTYRALMRALVARGHDVLFLERDKPWYAEHRDMPHPDFGRTILYDSLDSLDGTWRDAIRDADLVIVGSYVPDGVAVATLVLGLARGVVAFYDIDTPVTVAALAAGSCAYLVPDLIPRFDLYLSFSGGPVLDVLESNYGARMARPLYCCADPGIYYPEDAELRWDLGYLGTYSADRQPTLDALLVAPARSRPQQRFVVAGPQYPADIVWPGTVDRIEHLPPARHRWFYASQAFTLNVTRADMIRMGYSPSVRLFEAAACGTPIISDWWPGLDSFFAPGSEILIAADAGDVLAILDGRDLEARKTLADRARARVMAEHTPFHRAIAIEAYWNEAAAAQSRAARSR